MKAKPIRRLKNPAYPDRRRVLEDPLLLQNNMPPTWRSIPGMAGAVAVFLAANGSLKGADNAGATNKSIAVVAPIFEHGEGRGADGCVVVNPPVFLSEQEAMQVISEELEKHGVKLTQPAESDSWTKHSKNAVPIPERTDGWDAGKRVAVEFLSRDDNYPLSCSQQRAIRRRLIPSLPEDIIPTQIYDFPIAARFFSKQFEAKAAQKTYLGTFYDPIGYFPPKLETTNAAFQKYLNDNPVHKARWLNDNTQYDKTESQRLLRLQVQDFVKWLQGQGVI